MHPRISALVFIFILAVMSRLYSTQTPILTKEDAAELVVTDLLDGNADSVFLFVSRETVPSGEPVLDFTGTVVLTAPSLGWIAFVDDHPAANWEHTCRFVFIDYDTGDYQVYDTTRPPGAIGVLYWAYPNVAMSRFADVDFRAVEPPAPPSNMMYAPGENYAVIISGGANKWMNYVRYWNDVQFAYIILTGVYQFKKENVFLLFSDGLSDTVDMLDSTYMWSIDSPKDYDGDGIPDVYGPSTLGSVDDVFSLLADKVRLNDKLLVYMTDHGGTYGGWNTFAYLWDGDILTDSHLQELYLGLSQCKIMTVLEPCYSGGFMDDVGSNEEGGQGRAFASACAYDEPSWAFWDFEYDVFVYFWMSAMSQLNPMDIGDPAFADYDMNGMISFAEAFDYASWCDYIYSGLESPQYTDDPEGIGDYMFLGHRFWGDPIAVPFDDLYPWVIVDRYRGR